LAAAAVVDANLEEEEELLGAELLGLVTVVPTPALLLAEVE